ncbi:unnamed protein product [Owenia fusiformis]|uniref:Rhodanese domain-containing protein n=1 Tax=Owenia fusiformis TaxID=6347 RepID=A0A8S4NP39_OWEFU|nr:unnamed protein product [Owenia fusiformis]
MSAKSSSRNADILQKKIPRNPKYENVQATVDTGASVTKYMRKIEDIKKNYRYRKDELFKRMKVSTFVQLVIQVADIERQDLETARDETMISGTPYTGRPDTVGDSELKHLDASSPVPSLALTEGDYGAPAPDTMTSRSTMQSVISGVGEIDIESNKPVTAGRPSEDTDTCPYLLLDCRDRDEFDQCHIISSLCYPMAMLSRTCNGELKGMLQYRNQEGKIIVIYDDDERRASKAATTLVERGYTNLFMLSGGLKMAWKSFPKGLITGTVPFSISNQKTKQVLPATQKEFDNDDIDELLLQLDNVLEDKSVGSRLSSRSRTGGASSMSNQTARSNMTNRSTRPAFK